MDTRETPDANMLRTILDALPSLALVVDHDVRIQEYNEAAAEFLSLERPAVLKHRGGEILHCIHAADVPAGCGHGPSCKECVVRSSVSDAFQGKRITRRRARMEVHRGASSLEFYALVTASPFQYHGTPLVLLIIEDLSEIVELNRLVPICSICRKVRDAQESWLRVESYFKEHWNLDFSHGLCPECYEKERAKLLKNGPVAPGAPPGG